MKTKILGTLLTLLLLCSALKAANSGRFYASDRLSSGLITCICQDSYGYLWIGTEYGLNKFDGYRFTQYLHQTGDSTTLMNNDITTLFTARDGSLWIGSARGLMRYDYDTDRFQRLRVPDDRAPRINSLTETADGRLYIGTAGYGLYSLTRGNDYLDYESAINKRAANSFFGRVFIDRRGGLWRSSHDDVIERYPTINHQPSTINYKLSTINTFSSPYDMPVAYLDYSDDALLIVCKRGILRYTYKTGLVTDAGFDMTLLGSDSQVNCASIDHEGNIYIGTENDGLMAIKPGDKRLTRVENTNREIDLRLTDVSAIAEDRSGNIWVGCYKKGLLSASKEQEPFEAWSFVRQNYRTGGSTVSIVSSDDGGVWCLLKPGGVYKMAADGSITAHPSAPAAAEVMYRDGRGRYWLGTGRTLYRYYPEQGRATKVRDFEGRGINCITSDEQGTLYLSIFGTGLCILNPDTGETTMLNMKQTDRPGGYLCNNWIQGMTFDGEGSLWIATSSGAQMMKTGDRTLNAMGWNQLLDDKQCYCICQAGRDGDMLISTNGGLYVYRRKANKVELLADVPQLQDKFVCSMIPDPETTTIWLSTTQGIWEYDYKENTVEPHVIGNGLTSREYSLGAGLYANSRIYFGTSDGITVFRPDRVQRIPATVGDVHLTAISVNGRRLSPMHSRYEMSYRENSLVLEFSLLDFRNPENIGYEWRINGSKTWQQTSEGENRIMLSELQPGVYDIEVRATSVTGGQDTSRHGTLVRIIIDKPWYKSALAYLVYIAIVMGFIGLVLYNFERQRRRDLEETKMRFLINATHDIRSPLTLIMGPLQKLKQRLSDSESRQDLDTIDKNAQRLLLLVNQILDERKIDKGQMRLSCQETDLGEFVDHIFRLYEYNARQRNISYTYERAEQPVKVWIDRINFDKVVSNLLSNAFKYTFDGGSIAVRLTQDAERATLQVIDSGMGFEDDKTDRFFERFYQGKNSKDLHIDGTGIGLNLSRTITELHGGTVEARNRKDGQTGAILTVSLPLGKEHLKPEEIAVEGERLMVEGERLRVGERSSGMRSQQASRNLRILLVDDDADISRYISSELGNWYHFDYATNGREALKRLLADANQTAGTGFDLVISDIMMPEMDGITLLRSIKQNPNISHIPVILLTSKSEVAYRLEGLKKGADAYLAKPFNMEELHILIDNLVDNVRRLRGKFTGSARQKDSVEQVEVKGNNDVLMEKVMKVINSHLSDSDLNIDMLTREVGISRAQLHRKMKEITGISTSEFIRNIRLEQAARLIKENKINITQVAYSVGFNNQAHFSTVFKKYFGVTPTEYAQD